MSWEIKKNILVKPKKQININININKHTFAHIWKSDFAFSNEQTDKWINTNENLLILRKIK